MCLTSDGGRSRSVCRSDVPRRVALRHPVSIIAAEVQASVDDRMNSTGSRRCLIRLERRSARWSRVSSCCRARAIKPSLIRCAAGYALLSITGDRTRILVITTTCRDHRRCALGAYLFLVWYFFHTDALRRISHTRAVLTKSTSRATCWRAL